MALARSIGCNLCGGEVIELSSDLGGGKTTFTKGLAAGFGSTDHVSSPTFTISKIYKANDKRLYHYDFYRLPDAGLMRHEIEEALEDEAGVVVVEWADVARDVLPEQRLTVHIARTDENSRDVSLTYPVQLEYLLTGVKL